mmetsp:Transcript_5416/g.17459  ORF Transcript_5416/g.17459 Transcript_5416/m.17459 type:complete len:214 (-) Transcript_5416:180-821(-)
MEREEAGNCRVEGEMRPVHWRTSSMACPTTRNCSCIHCVMDGKMVTKAALSSADSHSYLCQRLSSLPSRLVTCLQALRNSSRRPSSYSCPLKGWSGPPPSRTACQASRVCFTRLHQTWPWTAVAWDCGGARRVLLPRGASMAAKSARFSWPRRLETQACSQRGLKRSPISLPLTPATPSALRRMWKRASFGGLVSGALQAKSAGGTPEFAPNS